MTGSLSSERHTSKRLRCQALESPAGRNCSRMNLAAQPASRPAHCLSSVPSDACAVPHAAHSDADKRRRRAQRECEEASWLWRSSVPFSQDTELTVLSWRRSGPHKLIERLLGLASMCGIKSPIPQTPPATPSLPSDRACRTPP
jgi:hypothetical protein